MKMKPEMTAEAKIFSAHDPSGTLLTKLCTRSLLILAKPRSDGREATSQLAFAATLEIGTASGGLLNTRD